MSSKKDKEVNPFEDFKKYSYKMLYEHPKLFVQHSLDDFAEDLTKAGFIVAAVYFTGGMAVPYKVGAAGLGYYFGNKVGDFIGEKVEDLVKYYVGIEEDTHQKSYEGFLKSLIDDVTEDTVKIIGLIDLLKFELLAPIVTSFVGNQANDNIELTRLLTVANSFSLISAGFKFVEEYNSWNEYANSAGNFISREICEYLGCSDGPFILGEQEVCPVDF